MVEKINVQISIEIEKMFQLSKRGVPLFRTAIQRMNYASGEDCPTGACKRVRDKQEIFTVEDNCPVHLKGGSADKILYGFTLGLALLGAGMSLFKIFQMS
uniref:Uncharacterized protein n=1 Tax=Rhodnius prolixus TaxID=13249 RepID=T1IDZ1_RHOPR